MSKKPDRLFIESGNRTVYNNLELKPQLEGLQHIDVFCLAMGFGFKEGIRTPLKKKDGMIRYASVKESHWRLIKAVAVAATNNLSIVGNVSQCANIAEEFANTGLHLIQAMVESTATGDLVTTIERSIMDRYKESLREKEKSQGQSSDGTSSKKVIPKILRKGEGHTIEFKSSLCWDYQNQSRSKILEYVIAKSLVGFMNAKGGTLLIGIDDEGDVLGLEKDYSTFKKKNRDGFELRLREIIDEYIGIEFSSLVTVEFEEIKQREVCIIRIRDAQQPIYLQKKDGTTEFVLRDGNRTTTLHPKKIEAYRKRRWVE